MIIVKNMIQGRVLTKSFMTDTSLSVVIARPAISSERITPNAYASLFSSSFILQDCSNDFVKRNGK